MIPKYIRLALGVIFLVLAICLFAAQQISVGVLFVLLAILLILFHFRNETMLVAFFYLRKENMPKARQFLLRIKHPERILIKPQQSYYYLLMGLCESQINIFQSEKYFKKALNIGLRMAHDKAMAYLSLAGIAMAKGNKREAERLLSDAGKYDKSKMLIDQIKTMKSQMGGVGAQKNMMANFQAGRRRA